MQAHSVYSATINSSSRRSSSSTYMQEHAGAAAAAAACSFAMRYSICSSCLFYSSNGSMIWGRRKKQAKKFSHNTHTHDFFIISLSLPLYLYLSLLFFQFQSDEKIEQYQAAAAATRLENDWGEEEEAYTIQWKLKLYHTCFCHHFFSYFKALSLYVCVSLELDPQLATAVLVYNQSAVQWNDSGKILVFWWRRRCWQFERSLDLWLVSV